jgi:origin recognition complex subunit 3
MTHFYANPLSVLLSRPENISEVIEAIQPEHIEAIRMLPSFRGKIEILLAEGKPQEARELLDSDEALLSEVRSTLGKKQAFIIKLQRKIHILAAAVSGEARQVDRLNIYIKAVSGQLEVSEIVQDFLSAINSLSPDETISLAKRIVNGIVSGDPSEGLRGWSKPAPLFLKEIERIQSAVTRLMRDADTAGTPLRSRYASQSKILRTTVVAQKVQLSKEKSSLSKLDESYSDLLDELSELLQDYFTFENPQDQFLHEIWLYDSKSPNREVFTPKPRYAIERALSVPHDYLGCTCCKASEEGLSASQPPTAILYQLYLETGGLINVFDLWSAFYTIIGGEDGEDCDERSALALFYRALADLKILGMVKQSRKKTDHLAKLAWKGL